MIHNVILHVQAIHNVNMNMHHRFSTTMYEKKIRSLSKHDAGKVSYILTFSANMANNLPLTRIFLGEITFIHFSRITVVVFVF